MYTVACNAVIKIPHIYLQNKTKQTHMHNWQTSQYIIHFYKQKMIPASTFYFENDNN